MTPAQSPATHEPFDGRYSQLVALLKDVAHCSDVFFTFRPDIHARLIAFERLREQVARDDDEFVEVEAA